jgi:hypothetical protein
LIRFFFVVAFFVVVAPRAVPPIGLRTAAGACSFLVVELLAGSRFGLSPSARPGGRSRCPG